MGIKVKLVKSIEGSNQRQRATVAGLGLWRMNQERLVKDTPENRGMVAKVAHLVKAETVSEEPALRKRMKPRKIRVRDAARQKAAAK